LAAACTSSNRNRAPATGTLPPDQREEWRSKGSGGQPSWGRIRRRARTGSSGEASSDPDAPGPSVGWERTGAARQAADRVRASVCAACRLSVSCRSCGRESRVVSEAGGWPPPAADTEAGRDGSGRKASKGQPERAQVEGPPGGPLRHLLPWPIRAPQPGAWSTKGLKAQPPEKTPQSQPQGLQVERRTPWISGFRGSRQVRTRKPCSPDGL